MTPEKGIEQKLEELSRAVGSENGLVEDVMSRIDSDPAHKVDRTIGLKSRPVIRRLIMSRFTRLAVAAMIIVAAALGIIFFVKSVPPAYALNQTIGANHSVRYLHIKSFGIVETEPKEFWVEFDEAGGVGKVRMSFPEWAGGGDGPKEIVWKEKKAQVWFVRKKSLVTVIDEKVVAEMLRFVEGNDPRLAVARLEEQQMRGKVEVDIVEPSRRSEPIIVTATYPHEGEIAGSQRVFFVDQGTKLVTRMELYRLKDGEYEYAGRVEYYDYNQAIDAKIFTLDDEVAADVLRIGQTGGQVGLAQGLLSDEQIAVEVVRQFFEALIGRDYAKAGMLMSGVPGDRMQEQFGKTRFIRIIAIEAPAENPATGGFQVPCTVEIEADGEVTRCQPSGPFVRQVYGQPGRWVISGGI